MYLKHRCLRVTATYPVRSAWIGPELGKPSHECNMAPCSGTRERRLSVLIRKIDKNRQESKQPNSN